MSPAASSSGLGEERAAVAKRHGAQFERAVAASQRVLKAWLEAADPRTLLLPDRLDADPAKRVYTPHNSGADLYPYLVLTAHLTDPDLGRRPAARDAAQRGAVHLGPGVRARQPGPLDGQARATEPVRRRRVREGRPRLGHGIPWAQPLVLPHGRPHDGRDGAGAGHLALRPPAGIGHRAQRRLSAGAGPAGGDDRRCAIPRVGPPHRRRLRRGSAAVQFRRARHELEFRDARGRSPSAASRSRERDGRGPHVAAGLRAPARFGAGEAVHARRGDACSIASSRRRRPTACSTTKWTPKRWRRSTSACPTTGATSTAPFTRSIR